MVDRNPFSKWDEDSVIYGLNLYDLNRTIRKLPEKDNNAATIEVPNEVIASLISEDLKCRVCLGKLENTLATTCLHRFCSDCLQRTLRMELGAKMHHECPSCRAKLASRRASKPDNKFDLLVQLFSGEKRKLDQISVDGEDGGEGARNGSSSEARSSPRPFGKNTTSNRNNEVEEAVDLKKYRDMHSKNVGKFREMSAQKQRAATKGTGGVNSRKSVNNNAHSAYEKKSAAAAAASSSKEAAVSAGDNKVWLKLYPVPEVRFSKYAVRTVFLAAIFSSSSNFSIL